MHRRTKQFSPARSTARQYALVHALAGAHCYTACALRTPCFVHVLGFVAGRSLTSRTTSTSWPWQLPVWFTRVKIVPETFSNAPEVVCCESCIAHDAVWLLLGWLLLAICAAVGVQLLWAVPSHRLHAIAACTDRSLPCMTSKPMSSWGWSWPVCCC